MLGVSSIGIITSLASTTVYAEDELLFNTAENISTNTTNTKTNEWMALQKALWTLFGIFYYNFYETFLKWLFGSIPTVGSEFIQSTRNNFLLWWLALILSIITFFIYFFVDAKESDNSGMDESKWECDLRKVMVNLINWIRDWRISGNERTLQIIIFCLIVVSVLLITLLINFLFSRLVITGSEWIVVMFYNLVTWIAGFSTIFRLTKWVYIDWIVNTYMDPKNTKEDVIKKSIIYLWIIVIGVVIIYTILNQFKTSLMS